MTKKIDLHIHTNNSDGTFSTQELLNMLEDKNASIISFTDHDNMDSYIDMRIKKAKIPNGMTVVQGVELTTAHDNTLVHLLGYGTDVGMMKKYVDEKHTKETDKIEKNRIIQCFAKLCDKYGLRFDKNLAADYNKRIHVILREELLKHQGNIEKFPAIQDNKKFYFEHYQNKHDKWYVNRAKLSPDIFPSLKDAIDFIHKTGGLAFFAHPYGYNFTDDEIQSIIESAVDVGIDGIEVEHSSNRQSDSEKCRQFAAKYNLYMSGGTDFHGNSRPHIELITGNNKNVSMTTKDIENWIRKIKHFEL